MITMASSRTIPDHIESNVNEDYYLCRKCSTHIALESQLLKKYHPAENKKNYMVFQNLINIVGDNNHFISNKKTTVRSFYCTKCTADLGFKFIALADPKDEIQEGRFILFTDKLMIWKGQDLLNAVTEEPVDKFPDGVITDGKNNQRIGVTDELVENKLLDGVTEEPFEKIMIEHVKQLLGVTVEQVEKKSLDGVSEEPVEEKSQDGVIEEQGERRLYDRVDEEVVEKKMKRQKMVHLGEAVERNELLLTQILLKLQIQPLFSFKIISQRWYSVIQSRFFCRLRDDVHNRAKGIILVVKRENSSDFQHLYFPINNERFEAKLVFGFAPPSRTDILSSSNGLLLCGFPPLDVWINRQPSKMVVYNPTTMSYFTLPTVSTGAILGAVLAFEPQKDYKVVLIVSSPNPPRRIDGSLLPQYQVLIFSSETRDWTSGGLFNLSSWFDLKFNNGVYWNAGVHWLNRHAKVGSFLSLRFDLRSFKMKSMMLPPPLLEKSSRNYYFGESGKSLLFVIPEFPSVQVYELLSDCSKWQVKYCFDLSGFLRHEQILQVFSVVCTEAGGKLVIRIPHMLVCLDVGGGSVILTSDDLYDDPVGFFQQAFCNERVIQYVQTISNV